VLAAVDAAVRRLPDRLTFAASGGALLVLAVAALTTGSNTTLTRPVLAALGLAAVYLIPILAARTGGMGPGDGKLAPAIGLCLGAVSLTAVVTATLAAVLLAGGYVAARSSPSESPVPTPSPTGRSCSWGPSLRSSFAAAAAS